MPKYKVTERTDGNMHYFLVTDGQMNAGRYLKKEDAEHRAAALNRGDESPWQKTHGGLIVNAYKVVEESGGYLVTDGKTNKGLYDRKELAEAKAKRLNEGLQNSAAFENGRTKAENDIGYMPKGSCGVAP